MYILAGRPAFSRRILIKDHKLYSSRIMMKQRLTENDMEKSVAMSQWFSQKIDNDEKF